MRRIAVLAPALVLSACGDCDPPGAARALAGAGAVECGFVPLGSDRGPTLDCADDALAAGQAFVAGWQSQGRDTEIRTYVARDADGGAWILSYDGGLPGSRPRLVASPCIGELQRDVDARGTEILTCVTRTADQMTLCAR